MDNDDCPLCRLQDFVELQRRDGKKKGWSHERIMRSWSPEQFRLAGLDFRLDRDMAECMLKAGPPVVFELDLSRPMS